MPKRIFDISRLKPGHRTEDRDPVDGRSSKREGKLIKQAISELSAMSLDEMTEALRSLEGGVSDGADKKTFTLEEIYGTSGLVGDVNSSFVDQLEDSSAPSEASLLNEMLEDGIDVERDWDANLEIGSLEVDQDINYSPVDSVEHHIAQITQDRLLEENIESLLASEDQENGPSDKAAGSDNQADLTQGDSSDFENVGHYVEDQDSSAREDADSELEYDAGAESVSQTAYSESYSPVSGVVKDEIVLSLLQVGVVTMSQVFDAIRSREEGMDLWRVLAKHPDTDTIQIEASVAQHQGYAFQPYLENTPSIQLVDDLLKLIGHEDLGRLVSAGLVPIGLDQNAFSGQLTLVVLSSDPLDSRVQTALLSCPSPIECRYSPGQVIQESLQSVTLWLQEKGAQSAEQDFAAAKSTSETAFSVEINPSLLVEPAPKPLSPAKLDELGQRIHKDRVVRTLLSEGIVSDQQAVEGLKLFDSEGGKIALWRIIADLKGVERESVYQAAARVYAFKLEEVDENKPDHDFVRLTMETLADEHREELMEMLLVPFEHSIDFETGTGRIIFITPDPTRPEINKLVHELDLGRFELRYASESQILRLLDTIFPRKNEYMEKVSEDKDAFDLGMSYDTGEDGLDEDALEAEISRSKLINLFEASLVEAVRQGTSDIHIFPNANRQIEIHLRTDGKLKKWHVEDKVQPEAFLAVVKDNSSNVDRFERDAAQDGFIQRQIDGALIRFRVSILPIASANQELRAESIVIRILDDRKVLTDISKLGMLDVAMERFNKAIRQPHGMIILTGPTGSGKSTTLVAALYQVVTPEVNVLTVEDPVEYIIKGVRQIKLSHKLDLEGALRAILRHDPDIVMVGEMRDRHTAELAIKLANTGHLTFSTLHTNDAPAAVSRLYKMGVEPFLIAYAINLVVAQRLIREVCSSCKSIDTDPDLVLMRSLGFTEKELKETTVYKATPGSKCPKCNGNGYKGRRAVCETLYFTREIRNMIAESGDAIDEDKIRIQAEKDGMLSLQDSARELVKMGVTTVDEMLRTTASE
ncbi:MAG: GspE/PulE family protein [Bacteroidetes bacterium]|nr:GspE/PulE family protein [Bacteroidota bacterium]